MFQGLEPASSIQSIDDEIVGGFRSLRFRPALERRYEDSIAVSQRRNLFFASLVGLVFYDLFLINDWKMVHDVFREAVIFRLGIMTPFAAAGIAALVGGFWSLQTLEKYCCFVAVLSVALVMALYCLTDSPYRSVYQYGPMMIIVFVAVVQRIRVRYCLVAVICMLAVQWAATVYSTFADAATCQAVFTIYMTVSLLVLFAAYGFERERRRTYLLSIRGQLMNDQLDRSAKIDPLTGLWNRRHLNAMMAAAWTAAETMPRTMAVILLDIDHFKCFNDTYGHMEGDLCLQRIGLCIRAALDHYGDVVVRFGGEEFLIFIAGIDVPSAKNAAHLLRQAIHREAVPHPALGPGAIVTASIGVATGQAPRMSAAVLMREADAALYEAKHAGRDCVLTRDVVENAATVAAAA